METMLMSVSNMQNKTNKTEIKNALKKIEGVNEVGVNLTSGTVKVDYNPPATEDAIKSCVEDSGYKIVYE